MLAVFMFPSTIIVISSYQSNSAGNMPHVFITVNLL